MGKRSIAAVVAVASTVVVAGCGSADGGGEEAQAGDGSLTVWTVEDVAERVTAQEEILARYTEATGVDVELVAIAEDQLATVLASSAAAGDLPDVIGAVSLNGINQLRTDDLLDTAAAAAVVESLGADTFSEQALRLVSEDGAPIAVPSDGWAQLLYYRSDLFEQAGLEPPTTFDAITTAAEKLSGQGMAGIVAATAPADSFTQQTFEHFALANGCDLLDDEGELALESPECVTALDFYASLIRDTSTPGAQDADTTRASYFAGDAAMVVWSSFLLDELAGLRNDALPTCEECAADPLFLAKNTGIVSAIQGPDGDEPASFGEIVSWAVLDGASPDAQGLVEFMMSDGYVDWLAVAPEGKVPTRFGTADEPTVYSDDWQALEAGVDTKALLSEVYGGETLDAVAAAPDGFDRWGIAEGEGELASAVAGQFVIPQVLAQMLDGGLAAADAAAQANEQAETIRADLG